MGSVWLASGVDSGTAYSIVKVITGVLWLGVGMVAGDV